MTAEQGTRLFEDLWALPEEPVGPHVSDEAFMQYALQRLSRDDVQSVDVHLASCLDCTTIMCQLLDVADAWRAQQAQQGRASLQAYIRTALLTVRQQLVVTRVLVCTAIALAKVRKGWGFTTDNLFEHWAIEDFICVLSEDAQGFVFAVDTKNAAYQDMLIRFALGDAETGEEHIAGLLVLHPDPIEEDHFVASARLDDVTLPTYCQPRLAVVALSTVQPQVVEMMLSAVSAAHEERDRQAWGVWAQRAVQAQRLPHEVAEAIRQRVNREVGNAQG
jgi:hypothetical protein